MIPLSVPNLTGKEARYLRECIETTFVSSVGPFVPRFEEMVARAAGSGHAVATTSGTTALHLALIGVGVKPGDLVIVPSFTFIASANSVAHAGADPWLFDVDQASWTLDANLLARTLERETARRGHDLVHRSTGRRVAALMPVYTLGMPADMDSIRETAAAYHLPIVADAAPAIGGDYKGRPLGQLADLTAFSFNGNKTVTAGSGGAIVGNDEDLIRQIRHISSTARVGTDYYHDRVGYNYRITNLQAAVGCAQMERLKEFVAAKRRIARVYREQLGGIPGVEFFPEGSWANSTCWLSGIMLPSARVHEGCARLKEKGVEARPFWRPIHLQPPYLHAPRTEQPVSEAIWERVLTLPCSTQLSPAEQQNVIDCLKEIL